MYKNNCGRNEWERHVFVNVKANAIFNKYAQLSKEIHNYEGN